MPNPEIDGSLAVSDFNRNNGVTRMHFLQMITKAHIDCVRSLCYVPDERVPLLEGARISKNEIAALEKQIRVSKLAIQALDRPNLHRLQELVFSTVPMIGSVHRIGELPLEKTHQLFKRAIGQSINKYVQIQSVQNAIFDDWQGRLTLQVPVALKGIPLFELGCYRFLQDETQFIPHRAP